MDFLKRWLHNLLITLTAFVGVGIFMLIFMSMFYPGSISFFVLMGQAVIQFASMLNLWPIIVLAVIISAMPRLKRRRE